MRNFNRLKFGLASLCFFFAAQSFAAAPLTTGADFLLMTTGARPDGMGQAFSAVADDINTLSFNPAGLGNIRLPEVGYGHESFVAGIDYDFVGGAIPMGVAGVLGLGYINMGTAPFNSTANPSTPSVAASDQAFIGGWGRSFYYLQVGASVKYIQRQLDTVQGNGFGFDAGIRYRPFPWLSLAGSAMNVGWGIQLANLEPLPTLFNTGIAWTAVESPEVTLNLAANAEFNIITATQQFSLGTEYVLEDAFSLRAGYLFNTLDANFNPDGFSAGAGVKVSFIQLDYAFQPFNTLGIVHRFSGMLLWDGPWVAGGEPNPPKFVNVMQTPKALQIRWEKALGSVESYEVTLQPLDGRDPIICPRVVNPYFEFKNYDPETLYKVSVKSIGNGGNPSFPSDEFYIETTSPLDEVKELYKKMGNDITKLTVAKGLSAKVDDAGLQLSWNRPEGSAASYNLYRESPGGRVEKVNKETKQNNRFWLTDTSGLEGYKWIVTSVGPKGKENTVGSYLWYPSPKEMEQLARLPSLRLTASPEPDHKVFLDWDKVPGAAGYALFVSHKADGVYEYYKDVSGTKATLLFKATQNHGKFYFMIIPKDANGAFIGWSNEAFVELAFEFWTK
jgi:hypothetical protein